MSSERATGADSCHLMSVEPRRLPVRGTSLWRAREMAVKGKGTRDDPWQLKTPPGTSDFTVWRDEGADPPVIVCMVGTTKLTYLARAIDDLHAWLREQGDWVPLGAADEQKPAADGTVEGWGRSESNPVGGWYGQRKGYRG